MPDDELDDGMVDVPFLRFYHSQNLRARTFDVLEAVEQARDRTKYRGALASIVVELTNAGIDYYFMRPLKLAKVGFVIEQSANVKIIAGATRVLGGVIHNIIGRMNQEQLLFVCDYIRELME
ncbi:MAG: hypothetical protein U0703_27605 [Anaerolineae bacterium]